MSACRRTGRRAERALSLLELLIVISLLGLFIGAVYESVIVGLRVVNASDEREDIRQQLANALDLLLREGSLASNVDNAEDQRFQFDADIDGDGSANTNINYRVQSGDLQRVYSGDTVTLVRDLASLDFDYVDLNGAAMTPPVTGASRDNIRVVQVTATATRDNETISLANATHLRNNN